MSFYLSEVKDLGISLLAPDINASQIDFSVVNNSILFGLIGIKNVGLTALQAISSERSKKPFKDLLDFCKRVDLRVVNKRVIENLICAGAFDQQFGNRAQKFEALSNLIDVAIEHKQAMTTGQMGLFGSQKTNANQDDYALPNIADWDIKTKLAKESEVMGFYLSAHPLDSYLCYIKWLKINSFQTIIEQYANQSSNQEPIVMGLGLKKNLRTITTKKGDPMAFMQIEDLSSNAEVIIFPKQYRNIANILQEHDAFIVQGNLDLTSATKCKIKALQVIPVEQFFEYWPEFKKLVITINQQNLEQLIANLEKNKGKTPVQIKFQENHKTLVIQTKYKVNPSLELMQQTTSLSQAAELIV